MTKHLIAAILAVLAVACAGRPAPLEPPSPVKIAVLIDLEDGVQAGPLTVQDFDPIISLLRDRGGEVGTGIVTADPDPPFVRLRVDPPPTPPERTGNAFRDHKLNEANEAKTKIWQAETDQAVGRFRSDVSRLLARSRPRGDDPWPLIGRAGVFLDESPRSWQAPPHRWLVYVSDRDRLVRRCRDIYGERVIEPGREFTDESGARYRCCSSGEWLAVDALAHTPDGTKICATASAAADLHYVIPLRTEVRIVTVKSTPGAGPLDDFSAARFEAMSAAFKFIAAEEAFAQGNQE